MLGSVLWDPWWRADLPHHFSGFPRIFPGNQLVERIYDYLHHSRDFLAWFSNFIGQLLYQLISTGLLVFVLQINWDIPMVKYFPAANRCNQVVAMNIQVHECGSLVLGGLATRSIMSLASSQRWSNLNGLIFAYCDRSIEFWRSLAWKKTFNDS